MAVSVVYVSGITKSVTCHLMLVIIGTLFDSQKSAHLQKMFLFASKTNNSQWATDELTNILKTEPNVSHWTYEQVHVFLCSEPELIPQKVLKRK